MARRREGGSKGARRRATVGWGRTVSSLSVENNPRAEGYLLGRIDCQHVNVQNSDGYSASMSTVPLSSRVGRAGRRYCLMFPLVAIPGSV